MGRQWHTVHLTPRHDNTPVFIVYVCILITKLWSSKFIELDAFGRPFLQIGYQKTYEVATYSCC